MPKKIIITVSNSIVYDQRIHRIATALSQKYEVLIIGRQINDTKLSNQLPYATMLLSIPFDKGVLMYAFFNIKLFFWLLFAKYDFVCAVDLDTILPAIFIKKIYKKTVVYDAHELFPESIEIVNRPFVKNIWEKIEAIAVPKVDGMYTVSQSIADYFSRKYKRNCALVRNMPLEQENEINTYTKKSYILYQGALNVGRGLEQLILSMHYIENIPLYIAGDGDLKNELKTLTERENLQHKVNFLGNITPVELKTITQNAFVGINLLENIGLSYYYSLANKFFDYVQAGIPQICIDFPEYRTLNQEFEVALLIDNLVPKNIANLFSSLYNNQSKYNELKNNCINASKYWNWSNESKQLIEFYDQF